MTRLSIRPRLLLAASALLLLALYFVPLWRIQLHAPQYPEGLGMLIRVNTITGMSPPDLNSINGLNHYIGMKTIEPEAIPVLAIMPWVVGGLILFALIVAAAGRRALVWAWLASFATAGAAGFAEFYLWSYDYGHNLASDAIIKVPGMSYQPPLIGTKQLLNFTAASWPALGSWLALVAFLLGVAALLPFARKRAIGRQESEGPAHRGVESAATLSAVALLLALSIACRPADPAPIAARMAHEHMQAASVAVMTVATVGSRASVTQAAREVVVSTTGPVRSIAAALRLVRPGGRVVVTAGRYREPTIMVTRPVTIIGEGLPIIDGEGTHAILTIAADDVTVRGFHLMHVGTSYVEDRAALRVQNAHTCDISGNRFSGAFFGIYLANVDGCRVEDNVLVASNTTETTSGNGIHLWSSRRVYIAGNRVTGFRDGLYFEFVHDTDVRNNVSEGNLRYGLHFMYSDDCQYLANIFRHNGSGVAVMYTHRVQMIGNRFEQNWGAAAYGLLLKEISDARLEDNVFYRNTTGLVADGANRIVADHNEFIENGWAVKLDASTVDGRLTRNNFVGNTFDVAANSREPSTMLVNNFWDAYRGYDLNKDGVGDVPFRPVRLFSMIVEQHEPALLLLRSAFVELLDAAERALPALTPTTLADARPSMRRIP